MITDQIPCSESKKLLGSNSWSSPDAAKGQSLCRLPGWLGHLDQDSIQFGVRMSVCLTVSSLFVLTKIPGEEGGFQEGMWVLITVLFVCWFPSMDVASVLEKSVQRLLGTLIGAGLGLACGFLSAEVKKAYGLCAQAICLGSSIAVVSFFVCVYATVRVRRARLIETMNYAVILCMLTFIICIMPFYSLHDKPWRKSVYRISNVVIGCFLGVGLSMLVFPRPTVPILQDKMTKQIELAGEASEAVLHTAADAFADKTYVPGALADKLASSQDRHSIRLVLPPNRRNWREPDCEYSFKHGHDAVLEKYDAAMKGYRAAKAQLGKLKYDPFNIGQPNDLLQIFTNEVSQTLARAERIQTTVVLIDGIVRNDPNHKFSEEHLVLLANVGTLVRKMLSAPLDSTASDAVEKKLSMKLVSLRRMIVDLATTVSASSESQLPSIVSIDNMVDDDAGQGAPKHVQGSHVCSLLFLQLAEHLALRSVRLYESWKKYDGVRLVAEDLRASLAVSTKSTEVLEVQRVAGDNEC
mmetsp:Transcript_13942/g.30263  ORF Transcript_13942/g.30263 Transcript_13942/m.30263 type:complete len:523 (+) Transcript_13942:114-1682(+)